MKHVFVFAFLVLSITSNGQTPLVNVLLNDSFNYSTYPDCDPAGLYWHIDDIGPQGALANHWYIYHSVDCNEPDTCYINDADTTRGALFISYGDTCDSALYGPIYKKGCDNFTKKRVSRGIDCSTANTIHLEFDYLAQMHFGYDRCALVYSADSGTTWIVLDSTFNSGYCPTDTHSGFWKHFQTILPSSANYNPDVIIGFEWRNNDDCLGNYISVAIDNLLLYKCISGPFEWTNINSDPYPNGSHFEFCQPYNCITFKLQNYLGSGYSWHFTGGTPLNSNDPEPIVCFSSAGTYTTTVTLSQLGCSNSDTIEVTIHPAIATPLISQDCDTLELSNSYVSYHWSSPSGFDPKYVINQTGVYGVTVTDGNGCKAHASKHAPAFARYVVDYCSGFPCFDFFTDILGVAYSWTISGATPSSSNLQNPQNVCYNALGSFPISLTLTYTNSSTATCSDSNFVELTHNTPTIDTVGHPSGHQGNSSILRVELINTSYSPHIFLNCTFQWYLDGNPYLGTGSVVDFPNIWIEDNTFGVPVGIYFLRIFDSNGCYADSNIIVVN